MKNLAKLKVLIPLLFIVVNIQSVLAQSKANIFDGTTQITWLGLDYTQAKFFLAQTENNKVPEASTSEMVQKYIPSWNYLFMLQQSKFNVAKAMHRAIVGYALNVTEKANQKITKNFIDNNPAEFKTLTEQNISDLVKNYDFQGNTGIGMMMFIEGMSKETGTEGAWVTFVDMKSNTVLFTTYLTAKIGGMGFRNNWADATFKMLLQIGADYDQWAK